MSRQAPRAFQGHCPRCGFHPDEMAEHPLTRIRHDLGLSQLGLAKAIAADAARHGETGMAAERQKVWRWEHRGIVPDRITQAALARILGVDPFAARRRGWPAWLDIVAPTRAGVSLVKDAS